MDAIHYKSEPDLAAPAIRICVALNTGDAQRYHFRETILFETGESKLLYLGPCDKSCLPQPPPRFQVLGKLEAKIIESYREGSA